MKQVSLPFVLPPVLALIKQRIESAKELDIGIAQQPLHLAQILALSRSAVTTIILVRKLEGWQDILARTYPEVLLVSMEFREELYALIERAHKPFYFTHGMPWNRSALKFEKLCLSRKGVVKLIEDGVGNYHSKTDRSLKTRLKNQIIYWLEGIKPYQQIVEKANIAGYCLYSIAPEFAYKGELCKKIPTEDFRNKMQAAAPLFQHLLVYQGMPVFLDTNDDGWYSYALKCKILREILPNEPMLYVRHPFQQHDLCADFPNFIPLEGQTHDWNELACYFLKTKRIYSVFSSSILGLKYLLGADVEHIPLYERFSQMTGHPIFTLDVSLQTLFQASNPHAERV